MHSAFNQWLLEQAAEDTQLPGVSQNPALPSFRRKPACMDADKAAPSCCRQVKNRPPRKPVIDTSHSRKAGMTSRVAFSQTGTSRQKSAAS